MAAFARNRRWVRDPDDRMIAGIAGGLAPVLGVPAWLVRIAFVLLAFAGGVGLVLYGAAWLMVPPRSGDDAPASAVGRASGRLASLDSPDVAPVVGVVAILVGVLIVMRAAGLLFSDGIVWPLALAAGGLILIWSRSIPEPRAGDDLTGAHWLRGLPPAAREAVVVLIGTRRGTQVRVVMGAIFVVAGVAAFLAASEGVEALWRSSLAVIAIAVGVLLVLGPWLWRLARELVAERRARIRSEERADMAAHLHDSVLQTLAMVQRRSDDPQEVVRLARRQERELRRWLAGGMSAAGTAITLGERLEQVATEAELEHGVPVELVRVGDAPLDDACEAVAAASAEALRNSMLHSGSRAISVYMEAGDDVTVFVRDRGRGFDPHEVSADRRGIAHSIRARMERCGGSAEVRSSPGEGTEVELTVPRGLGAARREETS